MKKHNSPVAFVSVSEIIRDKITRHNGNLHTEPSHPFVISTSFMAPDSENVKDSHGDDLDCFDQDCGYNQSSDWRVNPSNKTIINSSQTATSQFSENSSLRHQALLACQLTLGRSKSQSLIGAEPGGAAACDMSQIVARKDDSGYGGDDLSLIYDLDSLDDPLPASKHITDDAMIPIQTTTSPRSGSAVKFWLGEIRGREEAEVLSLSDIIPVSPDPGLGPVLTQINSRTNTILNICDSLQRMDTSDNSSLLLFSTLVRSLKLKVKTFVNFYCGITENFGLPGYVFRNSGFKIELLQHNDCIENICDKMMKVLMHSNDRLAIRNLVKKVRQLFLNSLNVVIGSHLAKSLAQSPVTSETLDEVLSACISSVSVSEQVARLGGVDSVAGELSRGKEEARLLRLLGCLCTAELARLSPQLLSLLLLILEDEARCEEVRREAVGVLAQVTGAKSGQPQLETFLVDNLQQLLSAIQSLVQSSSSQETFLLCAATLSNMTSISTQASHSILAGSLLPSLLSNPAIQRPETASVYILEQVVTLINNLAREAVMSGLLLSLCVQFFLELLLLARQNPDSTELYSSTHRTVSKAVIGLARLCLRPESACEIVRLGGLERLAEVARHQMFDHDETVKLAVVAAITSVNTDFLESFV